MGKADALLTLAAAVTGYDGKEVLHDVELAVRRGKITALIGPNGSGKSTVLRLCHGLLPLWNGLMTYEGKAVNGLSTAERVRRGIAFCPQGGRVFPDLDVGENLEVGGAYLPRREVGARLAAVLEVFPGLAPRLRQVAGTLSGGEQQMVAIARALVARPTLLMLDEPSLGLAPNVSSDLFSKVVEINRAHGLTILIVEQKVREVLAISDDLYALRLGRVAFCGPPSRLMANPRALRELFL